MAEGCYTEPYLPASYKGVPFEAMEVSSEHGRRGAEGEFPFGENTAYADLGRRIRTYSLRGRFPTNDHVARSAALIAVCETPGAGLLVHPTRGPVLVACRSLKVTDNPLEEQGVTYIDLDMVEAFDWVNGFAFGNLLQIGLSLVSLLAVSRASFERDYQPANLTFQQAQMSRNAASSGILEVRTELHRAVAADTTAADLNAWKALLDLEKAATNDTVLNDAKSTFDTLRLGMAGVDKFIDGDAQYQAFLRLANANAKVSALTGAGARSENAVYTMIRTIAAGYMARASLDEQTLTIADALKEYEQITAIFEQELAYARTTCDNLMFLELRKFMTAAQAALLNRIYNLPALVTYNFGGAVHSLVAAYEIYNDAKRFADIEAQNPSAWPFLVGPNVIAEAQ